MDFGMVLGFAAGTLTTIAFWPQLRQTWKTRSADDLSLGMLVTFTTGVFLWLLYGFSIHALPIILTNLITFLLTVAILILRIPLRLLSPDRAPLNRADTSGNRPVRPMRQGDSVWRGAGCYDRPSVRSSVCLV